MKKILFLLLCSFTSIAVFAQLPESEPNGTFATANSIQVFNNIIANVGNADADDYYRTILPADGTLKIYIQATNASATAGYLYIAGYDRRKSTQSFSQLISGSSTVPAGTTVFDTVVLRGQASDTFYFRFYTNRFFNYQFNYIMLDQSTNDVEPNNSFATALLTASGETKFGHTNYEANGSTLDPDDYYRTIFPADGTLKIYLKGINRASSAGFLYMRGYDRRKSITTFALYFPAAALAAGATSYDTITVYGQAADTFYFHLFSNRPFAYEFRYEMVDQSTNDVEPNNSFATALPIAMGETKSGHANYDANGSTLDPDDYYKTVFPVDGTLKVYIKASNRGASSGYLYMRGYDRRKSVTTFALYFPAAALAAGATTYDTITVYGQAADTFYFHLFASRPFAYEFRYEMVDQSTNDVEPNNTFATALPIAAGETKFGHTNYEANGSTLDPADYYKTVFPVDGTMKMYIKGINRGGSANYLYMRGYDRRKSVTSYAEFISGSPGATVYDTITLYGQASDTFYFHLYGNTPFAYEFRYEMQDTSLNDAEGNNSFAEATTLSGTEVKFGHTGYDFNGTYDVYDFYKTIFTATDSLKLYLEATNRSGAAATFSLYGFNTAQSQIYVRTKSNVPNGATVYDSVKMIITGAQTIYNRVGSNSEGFSYQLSINSKLPGNGFSINGPVSVCNNAIIYKALNVADNDVAYHWTLLSGGSLSFVDSIATVTWTTPGTHILQLYLSNAYGNSVTKQIIVTVDNLSPTSAPVITVKGRYLDIATVSNTAERRWYKDGVALGITDSVYYAATAGSYTAKYANTCGEGPASAAINFNAPQTQTISFPAVSNIGFALDSFRVLQATASSGLPVVYKIISGPGVLRNDSLFVTAAGTIVVQAAQFGNIDYGNATPVNISVTVVKGPHVITFNAIPNKIYSINADFALDAFASSGLPVSYSVVSGAATVSGNRLKMTGAGTVQVKAKQTGNVNYLAAPEITQSFCIGVRQIEPITGLTTVCPTTIRYTTKKITGALYEWSLSGGGIVTGNNDTATVQWQTPGTYTLYVKAYSTCDTVRSAAQSITVTVVASYATGLITDMLPVNNATGLSLPVTLQWNPVTNATSYDLYVWPVGFTQPTVPLDSGILQVTYDLNENIALNTAYNWKVVARNICASTSSAVQQFTAIVNSSSRPDLQMDTLIYQPTIYQGLPLTVTWRVKNAGENSTGLAGWKDRIYLSNNISLRVNDGSILLGEYNNPSYLLPGESYTQTKTVTIPQGIAGPWYLFVITDNAEAFCTSSSNCQVFWGIWRYNHHGNSIQESKEYNNYRYDLVTILDGPLPDLQVKTVGVPGAAFGGSNITVTYSVKNDGGIAAAGKVLPDCLQRTWRDRFFISEYPDFNINNANELPSKEIRFLKSGNTNCVNETLPYIDYLLPDSSYTTQHQLLLPYNFFGKQYIYVYTNGYNDSYEGPFNTNNIRRSDSVNITITPPADLVVSNIQNLTGIISGGQATINFTVTNQGANQPQSTETGWGDSVFICSSSTFNYADVIVKGSVHRSRPANFITGATYNGSLRLSIPNGISGTYYVFVKTDATKNVFEYNQENNNTLRSNAFTIALATPVDMLLTSILAPDTVRADVPFNLTYIVKNIGAGTVAEGWHDNFYADTDSLPQLTGRLISDVAHGPNDSLVANAQRTYTRQVVIQTYHGFSGKKIFIKGMADGTNAIYEHLAEGNNIVVNRPPVGGGVIYVKPALGDTVIDKRSNLKLLSLTAPATVNANTSVTVNWTVKNLGPLATTKTHWQDRIYLSSDTIINSGDIELKRISISQYTITGLLKDTQYQRSAVVQIPLTLSGNYYFIGRTDFYQEIVNDSIIDDNTYRIPVTIIAAPVPDLVITPLNNLPDSIWGGSVFYLKYNVQNTGSVTAQSPWYDMVHIQNNPIPDGFPLKTKMHTLSLAAGASYTDSILVEVPDYISGNQYILLRTDGNNSVYEGPAGDGNNMNVRTKLIYPYNNRPVPDIIVSALTIPDSVMLGKNITANYTVTNAGVNPAQGNLGNALYLSTNTVFESSLDKLTATSEIENVILQPGQSVSAQLNGKALPSVAGAYRSIVRTNVRNTIFEGANTNNNLKVSDTTTYIDARLLTLDQIKVDTLSPTAGNYYKVIVAANQDLLVSLTTAYSGNGSNAVYVSYNKVPDETNYDATGYNPTALNQPVLLSSTQAGTYYIKAQSFGISTNEPVSILVTSIPFSILNVTPAIMGQGRVTGTLRGGGFKTNTQILLRKNAVNYYVGTIQQFINSTSLNVLWNTTAVPLGVYDVVAVNPDNMETVLAAAVTIETKREYDLEYTKLIPSEVRPFGGVFTYKGKNRGNVDIEVIQGDITMVAENATVFKVSTTGRIRRYTKYVPQADSLITPDWYLTGKNRVVPFIGRNIAPGEEFSITVETRFKGGNVRTEQNGVFPLQCRMWGYSGADYAKDQVRNMEMLRLVLIHDPRANQFPNSEMIRDGRTGSKIFIEKMMNQYVLAGLMNWVDTTGLNFRWDCSRCLQLLPEIKPITNLADTFKFNPAGSTMVGTASLTGNQVFDKNQKFLLELNKGRYWWYYNGIAGSAGDSIGWDLLNINGTLSIQSTTTEPFKISLSSLAYDPYKQKNVNSQLGGWSPAYDTTFLIVKASGGITGYASDKIALDVRQFSSLNDMRQGHFSIALKQGYGLGPDSLLLVWTAYKPGFGEKGVDGVDGGPGEPGSPGGKGGPGNAQNPKGGTGGKGGRGSDQYGKFVPAQVGGRGGEGGDGYGEGGDGGDAGETGDAIEGVGTDGEEGGPGTNAGSHGGRGGKGGKGAKGGKGGQGGIGGKGGDGGNGGAGINSSYGGNGGDGGGGGRGGGNCSGGAAGGNGGNGGIGGTGPLGNGSYGASGPKGFFGPPLDCPPCSGPKPPGAEAQAAGDLLIDDGKAVFSTLTGLIDGEPFSVSDIIFEAANQTIGEISPGANLVVGGGDLVIGLLTGGVASEYKFGMKALIYISKGGDYILSNNSATAEWYNSNARPYVTMLITGLSIISSPTDFVAAALKQLSHFVPTDFTLMVQPCDPNEIVGPQGYDNEQFVSRSATMPYIIHFENDSLAQVAAQRVVVRQPISLKADPLSFKVGNFSFGGYSFEVPANQSNYFTVLNFDSLGYRVEVSAGIDIVNREAFWILQTIDPATGLAPANVFTGFLPPNDSTESGIGSVTYYIKPISSAITGDSITAKAAIVFDENVPIETNTWTNIVDAFAPTSSITNLPDSTPNTEITIHYTGVDDLGGSGVKFFNLYVSDNGATPVLFMTAAGEADTTILGEVGHIYSFYSTATDNVGNKETLVLLDNVKIIAGQSIICPGSNTSFSAGLSGINYQWQVNSGSGYSNITNGGIYSGTNSSLLSITAAPTSMYGYQYRCLVNGSAYSDEFLLKFGMNWQGTVSTAWENAANWSCGNLPDGNTDVVVDGGKPNYPIINSNVTVRTLRMKPGATGSVNTGFTLTVLK